ncbi:putative bifunctional diguanylate cyclase/phosphodiesterase [Nitratiruptor sp. SB155-2]|uniref:putative bifunctional diguanylate cyclase/phosphodiesterase n=1 Tax=Nitratiruptor sp. (strain SB155-2) TaxID=387092 RepID=UPI0001587092|nr:EAL domain-containing protein [Nitratiruptor sp. SB155-2]BAF70863.1 conserved hypothetical protein [Nitratiruptor sp. SB155-2]
MKKWLESIFIHPLLSLLLLAGSFWSIYFVTIDKIKTVTLEQELEHAKEDIFLLKSLLEEYSLQKKPRLIQRELVRFATKKHVQQIFLLCPNKVVRYANRRKWIGKRFEEAIDTQRAKHLLNEIDKKRYNVHIEDGRFIEAVIPLHYLYNPNKRRIEKGVMIIVYDLLPLIEQRTYAIQKLFFTLFAIMALLLALLFFFLYRFFLLKYQELGKLLLPTENTKCLFFTPINRLIEAQKQAIERATVMKNVIQNSDDAVLITDHAKNIVDCNRAFEKMSGYTKEEIIGKKPEEFLKSGLQDSSFYQKMWKNILKKGEWSGEIVDKRKDGSLFYALQSIFAIKDPLTNKITHYAAITKDITELAKKQETIQKLAFYDPLTKLANRVSFLQTLDEFIALGKRESFPFALLFIDLDNFKEINDTLGHDTGDKLLQAFVKRLKSLLREEDIAARLGGDEFVVLAPGISSPSKALELACRLQNAFQQPLMVDDRPITVQMSIGIALFPQDAKNANELLKAADIAMYKAKEKKNRCVLFQENMQQEALEKVTLKQELKKAIEKNELMLYLQPKISVRTKKVEGFEALIRWNHPTRGFIPPSKFIPLAEESALIIPLTEWIFQEVDRLLDQLQQNGIESPIAINISARHFATDKLIEQITTNIKKEYIQKGLIELEVTESAVMEDINKAMHYLQKLHSFGIKVALDDFGTGHSSLQYLKKLPIDTIKIDKTFIDHIINDNKDQAIVESTIEMADKLGMDTVAEGVETKEQAQFLEKIGIDYIQGYYYAKPMPFEEMLEFLQKF